MVPETFNVPVPVLVRPEPVMVSEMLELTVIVPVEATPTVRLVARAIGEFIVSVPVLKLVTNGSVAPLLVNVSELTLELPRVVFPVVKNIWFNRNAPARLLVLLIPAVNWMMASNAPPVGGTVLPPVQLPEALH